MGQGWQQGLCWRGEERGKGPLGTQGGLNCPEQSLSGHPTMLLHAQLKGRNVFHSFVCSSLFLNNEGGWDATSRCATCPGWGRGRR